MKTSFERVLFCLVLLSATACAMPKPYRLPADIVWPPEPDVPRIKYIESFAGSNYFAPEFSTAIVDSIVGAPPPKLFYKPAGVVADDRGNLYVSDAPGYVMVLDRETEQVRLVADSGQAKLVGVGGLAFHNGRGELYACDPIRKAVLVINPNTNKLVRQFSGSFTKPVAVAIDEQRNRLAVADTGLHAVQVLDAMTGEVLFSLGRRGTEEGEFNYPTSVAYGPDGRLFVSDTMNFRVQYFDADGVFGGSFGSLGLYPGQFSRPKGIGVDSEGHVYVVDAAFGNVQLFDPDTGDVLMSFGANGHEPGFFYVPHSLYIDSKDNIYVVDQVNRRVQIFRYLTRQEGRKILEESPSGDGED